VATVTASFSELSLEAKFNNFEADIAKTYATSEAEKPVFDGTTYLCSCKSSQCDSDQCHCYPGPGAPGGASACGHDKCTDYPSLCQCVSSSKVKA
jgi:hypothetical protein